MGVYHLARQTKFLRTNMSAANIVCAQYPNDEEAHKLIWSLIAKYEGKPIKVDILKRAVKEILFVTRL